MLIPSCTPGVEIFQVSRLLKAYGIPMRRRQSDSLVDLRWVAGENVARLVTKEMKDGSK